MDFSKWERLFEIEIAKIATTDDPAHDLLHFKRVVQLSKSLCTIEKGRLEVVIPAAWLHDFVIVPKDSPMRAQASKLSAEKATQYLESIHYPSEYLKEIAHAIEGHSHSANVDVKKIEAKIVQDADRLDALGAIGIARCFAIAGILKRPFYSEEDPFCTDRLPNDGQYTVDHFYRKLLKISETLKTQSAQQEGQKRVAFMREYLEQLKREI